MKPINDTAEICNKEKENPYIKSENIFYFNFTYFFYLNIRRYSLLLDPSFNRFKLNPWTGREVSIDNGRGA